MQGKKTRRFFETVLVVGSTCLWSGVAQAQVSRNRNAFHVEFNRSWDLPLTDPVKLIEIGQVTEPKKNNLLLLVGGKEQGDFHRQLLVTRWDGARFATATSTEFQGTVADALFVGDFRTTTPPTVMPAPPRGSKTDKPAPKQPATKQPKQSNVQPAKEVVTTEGVYSWTGQTLSRLFGVPVDLRVAVMRDKLPDLLVTGSGNQAVAFQVNEYDYKQYTSGPPTEGDGYVRFGIGTQEYPGVDKTQITPEIRYTQTYWAGRARWIIGLMRGSPLITPDAPNATTGDRLVVYAPKFSNRGKSFWAMKMDDFEENWRSEPLPGRVLDIRVGDPKNDGKEGVLVLTAENNDKARHLYFYALTTPLQ